QTADANGLGPQQYLLAVATQGRQFYLSGASDGPVSFDQLGQIEQQIQPELREGDWVGAVDVAADGLTAAVGGGSNAGGGGGGGGLTGFLVFAAIAAVIAVIIVVVVRRRKKGVGAGGG